MNPQALHGMVADLELSVMQALNNATAILDCVLVRIREMDLKGARDVRQIREAESALWGLHQLMECNDKCIESEFCNLKEALEAIKMDEGVFHSANPMGAGKWHNR